AFEHAPRERLEETPLQFTRIVRHLERERGEDRELQLRVGLCARVERIEQRHRLAQAEWRAAGDALAETREQRVERYLRVAGDHSANSGSPRFLNWTTLTALLSLPLPGFRPAKSNSLRSSNCDGRTSVMARRMDWMRPGSDFSHSLSMRPTTLRCRFSCEPHRVQGMIGNA